MLTAKVFRNPEIKLKVDGKEDELEHRE